MLSNGFENDADERSGVERMLVSGVAILVDSRARC